MDRQKVYRKISIHAPLAGCDWNRGRSCPQGRIFQSTHPLRGATWTACGTYSSRRNFNPRTPCGVRPRSFSFLSSSSNFNPRTPCGVRRFLRACVMMHDKFQSTHPLRGATAKLPKYSRQICAKATKFLQSQTKSGVVACWAKGKRPLFPALRGANLPGKTGTLPVRIR